MNRANQTKAPEMARADVVCRKIPGCSTNWVILPSAAPVDDVVDEGALLTAKLEAVELLSKSIVDIFHNIL